MTQDNTEPTLLLLPAYGRKYTNTLSMIADWEAGRDFKIHRGPQTNKHEIPEMARQGIVAIYLQGSYLPDAPTLRIDIKEK